MMSFKPFAFASAGLLLAVAPAAAQMPRQADTVRIQNNISFSMPGPTNDSPDAQKSREAAQRSIYEMSARGCDLLREVFAKECRLESVSVNIGIGRQFGGQQEGYTVNGSMSYQITPKP